MSFFGIRPDIPEDLEALRPGLLPPGADASGVDYCTPVPDRLPHPWLQLAVGSLGWLFLGRLLRFWMLPAAVEGFLLRRGDVLIFLPAGLLVASWLKPSLAKGRLRSAGVLLGGLIVVTPLHAFLLLVAASGWLLLLHGRFLRHVTAWHRARAFTTGRTVEDPSWENFGIERWWRGAVAPRRVKDTSPERTNLDRGLLILLAAFGAGLFALLFASTPIRGGMYAVAAVTAVLAGYAYLNVDEYRRAKKLRWRAALAAWKQALASFYFYNSSEERLPGLWQSPEGRCAQRAHCVRVGFRTAMPFLLLAASYFPVTTLVNDTFLYPGMARYSASITPSGDWVAAVVRDRLQSRGVDPGSVNAGALVAEILSSQGQAADLETSFVLDATPEGWTVLSVFSLLANWGETWVWVLTSLVLGGFLALLVPVLFLGSFFAATCGRAVLHVSRLWEPGSGGGDERPRTWMEWVQKLRSSPNELYSRGIFLGIDAYRGGPVVIPRSILNRHAHILGGTRSGKTARVLAPLAHQLIDGEASVVVFDLKGDMALFEEVRYSAMRERMPFKWFSTAPGDESFAFNPLNQHHLREYPTNSRAEIYAKALGLDHGDGYGKSHFSRQARDVLRRLLTQAEEAGTPLTSFRSILSYVEGLRSTLSRGGKNPRWVGPKGLFRTQKQEEDAGDLLVVIDSLARFEAFNVIPGDQFDGRLSSEKLEEVVLHSIDLLDAIRTPTVLFFKLPTGIGASSGREVGKLFLYALLTAATAIPKRQRRQTYLLLDEFQELVSTDLDVFFAQASGADIAVIAANQSNSQLLQVSPHFLMALQDNTHLEIVFSASNADAIRDLSYRSGEVYHETMSLSFGETPGGSTSQESFHENIGPRARVNDILRFSARPGHCRVTVRANDALAQFDGRSFEMRTMYHIGEQEFERRENAPWPKATGTIPMPLPATPTRSMDAASNDRGVTRDPGSATTAATPALDDVPFEFDDDSNEP